MQIHLMHPRKKLLSNIKGIKKQLLESPVLQIH